MNKYQISPSACRQRVSELYEHTFWAIFFTCHFTNVCSFDLEKTLVAMLFVVCHVHGVCHVIHHACIISVVPTSSVHISGHLLAL